MDRGRIYADASLAVKVAVPRYCRGYSAYLALLVEENQSSWADAVRGPLPGTRSDYRAGLISQVKRPAVNTGAATGPLAPVGWPAPIAVNGDVSLTAVLDAAAALGAVASILDHNASARSQRC